MHARPCANRTARNMWVKYPSSLFFSSFSCGNFFAAGTRVASIPYLGGAYANHVPVGDAQRGGYEAISPSDLSFSTCLVFLIVSYPAWFGGLGDTQYYAVFLTMFEKKADPVPLEARGWLSAGDAGVGLTRIAVSQVPRSGLRNLCSPSWDSKGVGILCMPGTDCAILVQ